MMGKGWVGVEVWRCACVVWVIWADETRRDETRTASIRQRQEQ